MNTTSGNSGILLVCPFRQGSPLKLVDPNDFHSCAGNNPPKWQHLILSKLPGFWTGFWSRGANGFLTPGGGVNPKFAQNRGFPLKLPENFMILKNKSWAKGGSGPQAPMDPLVAHYCHLHDLCYVLDHFQQTLSANACIVGKTNFSPMKNSCFGVWVPWPKFWICICVQSGLISNLCCLIWDKRGIELLYPTGGDFHPLFHLLEEWISSLES